MNSEFNYGPAFFPGLIGANGRLTAFCKGNSSTQSNPNNSQTVTDNRTAAADGSLAATNGATINVTNSDADTLQQLAESNQETSTASLAGMLDATKSALSANTSVSRAALDAGTDIFGQANQTIARSNDNSTDLAALAVRQALLAGQEISAGAARTVADTFTGYANNLKDNSGVAASTTADNIVKYVTIGATVIGLFIAFRSSKKN